MSEPKINVTIAELPDHVVQQIVAHADPEVFWLASPEYMHAWAALTGDTTMNEAAYTAPTQPNPPYVNAQLTPQGDAMLLTMRSENSGEGSAVMPVQMSIPLEDWDQFIADAAQVRGRAK